MNKNSYNKLANQIVKAFLKNKVIKPLPLSITKKMGPANEFRKLCESKINEPILSSILLLSLLLALYLKSFFKRKFNGLDLFEFIIVIA